MAAPVAELVGTDSQVRAEEAMGRVVRAQVKTASVAVEGAVQAKVEAVKVAAATVEGAWGEAELVA